MTEIYSHRLHGDIPRRVRNRIIANVQSIIEQHGDNPDQQEDMIEDLIDVAYDSYHVGWQSGFIDDTQEPSTIERDESIMEALEKLKKTIDENVSLNRRSNNSILQFADTSDDDHLFNPGGTE